MKELIQNIEQWADERNLINGSTPQKQMLKLMEEFGELCAGIAKNKPEMIKDAIGDCFVVLTIMNNQVEMQIDIDSVINDSYNIVKKTDDDTSISMLLFMYHAGMLANAIGRDEDTSESISCLFASLVLISSKCYLNFNDCIQHAYNQIKDRKGKMIDGVFVKREDLPNS